jgi:hypothetical protein
MKMRTYHINGGLLPDTLKIKESFKESTPLTEEERRVLAGVEAVVSPNFVGTVDDVTLTRIIRGYETYAERVKDTADCYEKIAKFRLENKIENILTNRIPRDEAFHKAFTTTVYGVPLPPSPIQGWYC